MSLLRKSLISLCLVGTTFSGTIGLSAAPTQAMEPESKVSQCKRLVHATIEYANSVMAREGDAANPQRAVNRSATKLKWFKSRRFSDPKIQQFHQRASTFNNTLQNSLVSIAQAGRRQDAEAVKRIMAKVEAMRPAANQLDREIGTYCGAHIQK